MLDVLTVQFPIDAKVFLLDTASKLGLELIHSPIRWVRGLSPRGSWSGWLINHFHLNHWLRIPGDIPPFLHVFTVSCLAAQETTRLIMKVTNKIQLYRLIYYS
jgi:hypothetical protein